MQWPKFHQVFVDANVLYSRTLRDWLGLIYTQGEQPTFGVNWSEDVLAEAAYHLRKKHPHWNGAKISTVCDKVRQTFEVGRVAQYSVPEVVGITDQFDLHVHAVTIACDADILLTRNGKDFPSSEHYDVMTPDDFFVLVDNTAPQVVRQSVVQQRNYWAKRTSDVDLPDALARAGCCNFAGRVLHHLQRLALSGD